VITLYDADRCPYCARTRIVLAEKGIEYETVVVDLADRPAWIYEKNVTGRVPVLEEDAFVLSESAVINEYLDERSPEPPLLPADPAARAAARMLIFRFDDLSRPYYALRREEEGARERLDVARWDEKPLVLVLREVREVRRSPADDRQAERHRLAPDRAVRLPVSG
jgi:glutathione S-transferase